jgi:hypothetical protein
MKYKEKILKRGNWQEVFEAVLLDKNWKWSRFPMAKRLPDHCVWLSGRRSVWVPAGVGSNQFPACVVLCLKLFRLGQ